MKKVVIFLFLVILFYSCDMTGQSSSTAEDAAGFSVLFWNLENLFDTLDDSLTDDEEFTPQGMRNWDNYRYFLKTRSVWKTILAAGGRRPPEIIAVCEVENRKVLEDLFVRSPFGKYGYRIVHRDSPDPRGIDCALIFDSALFKLTSVSYIQPKLADEGGHPTRDIVYAVLLSGKDSLHLFINHWPSKYGGTGFTEPYRKKAAEKLRNMVDSLFLYCDDPYVICTGDFNDTPESVSISGILLADPEDNREQEKKLIRIPPVMERVEGTIRYQGQWQCIDHFFASQKFFQTGPGFFIRDSLVRIYSPEFLLEEDDAYGGVKPYRTWIGIRYNGGVSDHLPILMQVEERITVPLHLRTHPL